MLAKVSGLKSKPMADAKNRIIHVIRGHKTSADANSFNSSNSQTEKKMRQQIRRIRSICCFKRKLFQLLKLFLSYSWIA